MNGPQGARLPTGGIQTGTWEGVTVTASRNRADNDAQRGAAEGTDGATAEVSLSAESRAPHSPTTHSPRRAGLGRGLAALIPQTQDEEPTRIARPLDVLFPAREESGSSAPVRARGGSARELLNPPSAGHGGAAQKKRTSRSGKGRSGDVGGAVGATGKRTDRGSSEPSRRAAGGKALFAAVLDDGDVSRETSPRTQDDDRSPEREAPSPTASTSDVSRETSLTTQPAGVRAAAIEASSGESGGDELLEVPGTTFADVPLEWIIPNTRQPREVFDQDELEELAASIREVGVLQPIVVRPIDTAETPSQALLDALADNPEARYELIMGERRLRASELAGNTTIPALVRRTDDEDLLRDALLENLHRAQLNPLEEASAYQQLMADFGATQEELSKRIARSRPQIANTLRLLRLPVPVQRKVAAGVISAGHARALLALGSVEDMEALADRIVAEGLSVRTTEELVRIGQPKASQSPRRSAPATTSPAGVRLQEKLTEVWDTRVTVTQGQRKGRIVIEFAGEEDLERLAALMLAQP